MAVVMVDSDKKPRLDSGTDEDLGLHRALLAGGKPWRNLGKAKLYEAAERKSQISRQVEVARMANF
jgi:hypothetical protein